MKWFPWFSWILPLLLAGCAAQGVAPPALQKQAAAASQQAARASTGQNWRAAAALWREAARRHLALDDWTMAGGAQLGQAQALRALGQSAEAVALLDGLLRSDAYPAAIRAEAHYQLALLASEQGEADAALVHLDGAQRLADGKSGLAAAIANLRGRLALRGGDASAARRFAAEAISLPGVEPHERANALRLQGRAAMRDKDWPGARRALDAALVLDRGLARPGAIAADLKALAELATASGDPAAASLASRAAAVCAAAGDMVCRLD
ncbi:hypothetical protein FNU76_02100 [Chitinimonas arctica]|uniref:Tetratricopeptide repeat protein n=1 Tax=Chitinimonas arctica TaxID=2594795 RepID=A0A516SAS3_9NEIS|nr:hypothetical protein [Chitinimonas arctica]QDQ25239.1 hypothetical protein FNU76_02100 [Chitinimonas arctica]